MKYIDFENWKRKQHFAFFYKMDYPQYNICMDLDITKFLAYTRKNNLSFYYSMIYATSEVLNHIEEFRYRIREGKVVLHDKIHPSFTDMSNDCGDELFKLVTLDLEGSLEQFVESAKVASKDQTVYFNPDKQTGRDDLIYITCIPWISFTHLSHTISLNRDDAVPRISWGKYFQRDNKTLLPFSVQVHHALIDGFHVGKYTNQLQAWLDQY